MGDLTLFEALTGGAFDRLNWQHSGEFDQNFSKTSNECKRKACTTGSGHWIEQHFRIDRMTAKNLSCKLKATIPLAYSTFGFTSSWVKQLIPILQVYWDQIAMNVQCLCAYTSKNLIVFSLLVSHSLRHVGAYNAPAALWAVALLGHELHFSFSLVSVFQFSFSLVSV